MKKEILHLNREAIYANWAGSLKRSIQAWLFLPNSATESDYTQPLSTCEPILSTLCEAFLSNKAFMVQCIPIKNFMKAPINEFKIKISEGRIFYGSSKRFKKMSNSECIRLENRREIVEAACNPKVKIFKSPFKNDMNRMITLSRILLPPDNSYVIGVVHSENRKLTSEDWWLQEIFIDLLANGWRRSYFGALRFRYETLRKHWDIEPLVEASARLIWNVAWNLTIIEKAKYVKDYRPEWPFKDIQLVCPEKDGEFIDLLVADFIRSCIFETRRTRNFEKLLKIFPHLVLENESYINSNFNQLKVNLFEAEYYDKTPHDEKDNKNQLEYNEPAYQLTLDLETGKGFQKTRQAVAYLYVVIYEYFHKKDRYKLPEERITNIKKAVNRLSNFIRQKGKDKNRPRIQLRSFLQNSFDHLERWSRPENFPELYLALECKDNGERSSQKSRKIPLLIDVRQSVDQFRPIILECLQIGPTQGKININSAWISAWMLYQILDDSLLEKHGLGKKTNDSCTRFQAEYVHNLCIVAKYVIQYFIYPQLEKRQSPKRKKSKSEEIWNPDELPDLPTELPTELQGPEFDQAQMFLLAEWAHDEGVSRTIPLYSWLKDMAKPELLLYATGKEGSHRQHIFHVQEVCLMGLLFWKSQIKIQNTWTSGAEYLTGVLFHGKKASKTKYMKMKKRLLQNWFVSSLLHDIGFALKVVPEAFSLFEDTSSKAVKKMLEDIGKSVEMVNGAFHSSLKGDPTPSRNIESLRPADHASVSFVQVREQLEKIKSFNDDEVDRYYDALKAIIEHSDSDLPVDFMKSPLSALLLFCDKIQDWERPRFDSEDLANVFLNYVRHEEDPFYPFKPKRLSPECNLSLVGKLNNEGNIVFKRHNGSEVEIHLDWEVPDQTSFEPVDSWLDICRGLQRIRVPKEININELAKITLRLTHKRKKDDPPEMENLEAFALKKSEQFGGLLDWAAKARNKVSGLCYEEKDPFSETLEIRVPDIGKTHPLDFDPTGFYKAFRSYKKEKAGNKQ